MNIIFGGSFNPPTLAHKEIYLYIKSKLAFDNFIYLPVSNKYSKHDLIDNIDRYNMLKIMMEEYSDVLISKDEFDDKEYMGTYHYLKKQKEDSIFLIGSDNLRDLENWINFNKLVSEFKFIVISRNEMNDKDYIESHMILSKYKDNFIVFDNFNMEVSSSLFRKTKNNKYLDNKVYEYIKNNHLYEVNNE